MKGTGPERCNGCAAPAVVRMQGVALCARCGLERSFSPDGKLRRTRRALVFGLFSSGFLAKMAIGAVAVAAIGGAALAMPGTVSEPFPAVPVATTQFAGTATVTSVDPVVEAPAEVLERAREYAASVESWGKCVSDAARGHSGEGFDPTEFCNELPAAAEHGLVNPAGHERGKSAATPGHNDPDDTPGKSAATPGHNDPDDTPGKSDAAPGKSAATPGHNDPDDTPGKSAATPGHNDPDE